MNRVAAERDIRPKVGRYRLRARHDERHPFHRVRSGRPVQDRIIAKASANASDSRGRSDAVEKTLYLHQAGGLGFCKQALSGAKTVLGPSDLAQIHTSCSPTSRNSEAIRMAYVPALFRSRSSRHTYSTLLNKNGNDPKVVQELLRHANLKTTMDTYTQALSREKRKAHRGVIRLVVPRRVVPRRA
jgi:hypothetical protein